MSSSNAAAAVPDALDCPVPEPEPEPAVDSLELPEESTHKKGSTKKKVKKVRPQTYDEV